MKNVTRKFYLPTALFFVFALASYYKTASVATIQEISSIQQIRKNLDHADVNTYVIFDVDDTLTYNTSVLFQSWFRNTVTGKNFYDQFEKHAQSKEDYRAYRNHVVATWMVKDAKQLLEPGITDIIKQLQDRAVKVIALTHMRTGSLGRTIIPSLPQWRYEKLAKVGIDFSKSFKQQEIRLTTRSLSRHPLFYKGILLTDDIAKGRVLGEFLDAIKLKPKKVIFLDDKRSNVVSVQEEMNKRGISFEGFVYRAIDTLPRKFDEKVLNYQLKHLKEHDELISDKDAHKAVYGGNKS